MNLFLCYFLLFSKYSHEFTLNKNYASYI
jgi:hypothetical protein